MLCHGLSHLTGDLLTWWRERQGQGTGGSPGSKCKGKLVCLWAPEGARWARESKCLLGLGDGERPTASAVLPTALSLGRAAARTDTSLNCMFVCVFVRGKGSGFI